MIATRTSLLLLAFVMVLACTTVRGMEVDEDERPWGWGNVEIHESRQEVERFIAEREYRIAHAADPAPMHLFAEKEGAQKKRAGHTAEDLKAMEEMKNMKFIPHRLYATRSAKKHVATA